MRYFNFMLSGAILAVISGGQGYDADSLFFGLTSNDSCFRLCYYFQMKFIDL